MKLAREEWLSLGNRQNVRWVPLNRRTHSMNLRFSYDDLHRLTWIEDDYVQYLDYDAIGNIIYYCKTLQEGDKETAEGLVLKCWEMIPEPKIPWGSPRALTAHIVAFYI